MSVYIFMYGDAFGYRDGSLNKGRTRGLTRTHTHTYISTNTYRYISIYLCVSIDIEIVICTSVYIIVYTPPPPAPPAASSLVGSMFHAMTSFVSRPQLSPLIFTTIPHGLEHDTLLRPPV